MSIILDTYYNITEIQANYYDKVATDSLFSNIDLSSYYTKSEVYDIDNELSTLILYTYTKTEIDSQLTDYTTNAYLQGNYMTSTPITETLMNNCGSMTFLVDNFYDKTYLDNQFSLKADVPQLTELVTTDYLTTKCINIVDLSTYYYKKTETDNMLLYYSTGSYVDYNVCTKTDTDNLLADKLINIGGIDLPGMLDIGTSGYTNSRIRCNAEVNGYTGYAELKAASSYDLFLNLSTTRTDGGWMYFKINNDDYIQLPGSDNNVNIYKDTAISGNLDVGKVLTLKRIPGVSDTQPLNIINESPGGATGISYQPTASGQCFLINYTTAQSAAGWAESVNWGSSNEFIIKSGSKGLTIKPTGDTTISGKLDVGPSQAQSRITTYFNHAGSTGHMMMEGRYRDQGYLHFETNYQYGEMLLTVRNI